MKNVTISMDEEVAAWARVAAARAEQSVSRFVGELLRQHMEAERRYEEAMRAFFAREPTGGSGDADLPGRDEVHDRSLLRR